ATRAGFRGRGRLLAAASDAELILGELPDRSQLAEAPLIALLLRHAHRVHLEGLTLRKVGAGHGVDGVDEGQVRFELTDGLHPGLHLGVLELLREGGHAGRILNRCGAARTRTSWGCLARDRWRMHPTPRSASSDVHVEEAVDVAFGILEP